MPRGAGEDDATRRLRRRPARLRAGGRAQALEARARPSQKAGVGPHRHLVEFRGRSELARRRDGHRRGVRAGRRRSRWPASAIGKGFAGTIKRHNFTPRPGVARLAQRPQAGLDRRLRDSVARLQGHAMAGRMGGKRVTQVGLSCTTSTPSRTCCSSRAPCRARRTASSRSRGDEPMAALRLRCSTAAGKESKHVTLDDAVFGAELEAAPRARGRARRAERRTRRHARREEPRASSPAAAPSRGARRAPGAPAQGTIRAPQFTGGGVAFPPSPRDFEVKVNRKARRAALRGGALEPRRQRDRSRSSTATPSTSLRRRRPRRSSTAGARSARSSSSRTRTRTTLIKSFRNLDRRRRHRAVRARGGRGRLGALAARQRGGAAARRAEASAVPVSCSPTRSCSRRSSRRRATR